MIVPTVHRVGTRGEGLALPPAIRRIAGMLAVDDIRRDGENGLGMYRIAIGRVLADLGHEARHQIRGDVVHQCIGIAECWELAFDTIIHREAVRVAYDMHLGMAYRGKTIRHHR